MGIAGRGVGGWEMAGTGGCGIGVRMGLGMQDGDVEGMGDV